MGSLTGWLVEAVATDDLDTYKPVVDGLGLERQACVVHVKKNVARRLRKVRIRQDWKSRLRSLLDELHYGEGKRLIDMEREVREESAPLPAVDARDTNNARERLIGRNKIRYKTLRGCKDLEGMMNGLWLTQRVRGESGMAMGELLAAQRLDDAR